MRKGTSLPINTMSVVIILVLFAALFFAAVSNGINEGVGELNQFAEDNSADLEDSSFSKKDNEKNHVIRNVDMDGEYSDAVFGKEKYQVRNL